MNADTVLIYLDRARYYALDAVSTISQCLCKPDATLKINGRTYKVEKLLGEGGKFEAAATSSSEPCQLISTRALSLIL
jgi:hypothetical protein